MTVLLATSTALADHFTGEDDVTGRIAIVDTEQRSVVLTDGMTFFVSESISIEGLKLGDAVMVTFRTENGRITKSLELRAVSRLARLWHTQGKTTEARDLLAPVYDCFTEGFDTADLKEAKALLEELG